MFRLRRKQRQLQKQTSAVRGNREESGQRGKRTEERSNYSNAMLLPPMLSSKAATKYHASVSAVL